MSVGKTVGYPPSKSIFPFLPSFLLFIPLLWLLPFSCVLANSHVAEIVTDPASTSVVDRGGFGNGMMDGQIEILDIF